MKSQTEEKKEIIIIILCLLLGISLLILNKTNNELKEEQEISEAWANQATQEHYLFTDCAN